MLGGQEIRHRWIAGITACVLSIYSGTVLFYVATNADLGLRCLLTNDVSTQKGVQIRQIRTAASDGEIGLLPNLFGPEPQVGDFLLKIGDHPIESFTDYAAAMADLPLSFKQNVPFDSRLEDTNPIDAEKNYQSLPSVINYFANPTRISRPETADSNLDAAKIAIPPEPISQEVQSGQYARVQFRRAGSSEVHTAWLRIKTLPVLEVLLSIIWCLLELGLFAVAGLSFCHRPQDQASRLFFGLSLVTVPAFVGGYHWWVISASPMLLIPLVACMVLLPVVTLHFYLNYPARHWLSQKFENSLLGVMYAPPALMLLVMGVLLTTLHWSRFDDGLRPYQDLLLIWMRAAIDIYILVALGYFAASVVCMFDNYRKCHKSSEQKQLQWILIAALLATPLVFYAVYLAYTDRVQLALGSGRIPMVIVSLLFLTAYAIGILRYRLMLIDQMLSRHTLYLISRQSVNLAYSLLIAFGSIVAAYRGISVPEQLVPLAIFLTVAILAMGWLRDTLQQMIDRRFFREKYRLDRAMRQMNLVVAQVADVRTLADHMLRSCREVLQVKFSALYLRDGAGSDFELVSSVGGRSLLPRVTLDPDAEQLLQQVGSYQRIPGAFKGTAASLQQLHREWQSQLMHGFEVDNLLTGLVVLGPKSSATQFTAEDTTFVAAIGQMTGVALQCVRVQQNVSRLDDILQEKVRKIETQDRQLKILKNQLAAVHAPDPEESGNDVVAVRTQQFDAGAIRGSSPALMQVLDSARKVANSNSSVLIRGESGTGKELLAAALHHNSPRANGPMVSLNCAALSPSLLESELFGHVKGAFTGAHRDTIGRFQMADQGTLFLDEIGDVPPDVQVKLLRVLQERRFEPVGSRESIAVDVRLIAATHQNLEQFMQAGKFREDLYYRLNVITLSLPPLRDRKEDIFELAVNFLREASDKAEKSIRDIDDLAMRAMLNYSWPGNIRELHNAIQRAVLLADGDCVLLENLPAEVQQAELTDFPPPASTGLLNDKSKSMPSTASARQNLDRIGESADHEKRQLLEALNASDGNKAKAARLMGLPRSTFYSRLKKYQL